MGEIQAQTRRAETTIVQVINPTVASPLLRAALYVFAGLGFLAGLIMTTDAMTDVPGRDALHVVEGQPASVDRVIRTRAKARPYDRYQQSDTYNIRIALEASGGSQTLLIAEPQLQAQDIAALRGARLTALVDGSGGVWELKSPSTTFFTYDDTSATQRAGKRLSRVFSPLFLGAGVVAVWLLNRRRTAAAPPGAL